MYSDHKPRLIHLVSEDAWVVDCLECRAQGTAPIGIGLPVRDRVAAEMLWQNHRGRKGRPPARAAG